MCESQKSSSEARFREISPAEIPNMCDEMLTLPLFQASSLLDPPRAPAARVGTVVIAGGAGLVGAGLVEAFLRAGHIVIVPSRDPLRLQSLASRLAGAPVGSLRSVVADVSNPQGAQLVADLAQTAGPPVIAAAAALGGWWQPQRLLDMSLPVWNGLLNNLLTSHFVFAKHILPLMLLQGGAFTFINGLAAEEPHPLSGPISVAAAAQLMLGRAFAKELSQSLVRINEVVLGPILNPQRASPSHPQWLDSTAVGNLVHVLSTRSTARGETIRVPHRIALAQAIARLAP